VTAVDNDVTTTTTTTVDTRATGAGRGVEPASRNRRDAEAASSETGFAVDWQEVPMPHVRIPVVHVEMPGMGSVVAQTRWIAQTAVSAMPQPRRLLYYGGLGALAALGLVEWPVAAAVAAGVWVATHTGRRGEPQGPSGPVPGEASQAGRRVPATAR
jgi:hypothetical protein